MPTSKTRLRALIEELTADSLVALVRCEAGKPYGGPQEAMGRLRELELVEKASWSCTDLGREVVGELVGIPARAPKKAPVRTAPVSIPHGPLRMPRVATPAPGTKFKAPEGVVVSVATACRETICFQCSGEIPMDADCVWVEGTGIFHPDCIEQPS